MGFLATNNQGRFGNCIFRFLASRLFIIFYNYSHIDKFPNNYYITIDDIIFNNLCMYVLNTGKFPPTNTLQYDYLWFDGYYQNDYIYNLYKKELIEYIKNNPYEIIETDRAEKYFVKDILGPKPKVDFEYKTIIHLRIEDYIELDLAMDPRCLEPVLKKCEQPFLFVHKPIGNEYDQKYIDYIKTKYPSSHYYSEDIIQCYNLMRHAEILICSKSTASWVAALFNETNLKIYMPKNYGNLVHETFQYPNNKTEIYEWEIITKEGLMAL